MDNKRKIVGTVLGKGPAKLRKISLNAFETGDHEIQASDEGSNAVIEGTPANGTGVSSSDMVDHALEEIVLKTALWITNNMDKAAALIEKSKDNPMLAFLSDTHGVTAGGRMYLREMQRLKTEKEVQAVCSGAQEAPIVHASQIASFIEQSRLAAAAGNYAGTFPSLLGQHVTPVPAAAPRERKNRWGPSVTESSQLPQSKPSTAAPNLSAHVAPLSSAVANTSSSSNRSRFGEPSTHTSEAAQIAHLAANFDSTGQDGVHLERLLREQKEMQLLESRIRDAASQGISASGDNKSIIEVAKFLAEHADSSTDPNNIHASSMAARKGPALLMAEKQAALYLERLAQYQELAALHDDNYRDTVEEAERNGGVIEGGTWEHRKRAKEMLTTASKNLELTLLGSGKHHMADYLPPEVLSAFLKNAEHVSKGTANTTGSVDVHTIDASNVGFQLLKKSGWAEGSGLGAQGTGIVNPISTTSSSSGAANTAPIVVNGVSISGGRGPEGAGIGVSATHEVTEGDSEFDQYRKRMMLAYRFRPNPLNNPRRDYY